MVMNLTEKEINQRYQEDIFRHFEKSCHLKQTNDSWRVDETYIKVKGQWMYLYRAVDSEVYD